MSLPTELKKKHFHPMNKYVDTVNLIADRLDKLSDYEKTTYAELLQAEKYSLTAGGKHLRGLILMKCASLGDISKSDALDFACALEMVHTYSLIHDDLPEMDNDDMRRGMPTCHIKFGSDIALLAGDALLTKAFSVIASQTGVSSDKRIECVKILADKCGEHGMLAGQVIDKSSEGISISLDVLDELHSRKTGDMFKAAVLMGCTLGSVDSSVTEKLIEYISLLGLAFQIKDDILDVTSSSDVLGKNVLSDEKSFKSTYVTIYGLDKSFEILNDIISQAIVIAEQIGDEFFIDLANYFLKRDK